MQLGLAVVFAVMVVSRYYYAVHVLLFTWSLAGLSKRMQLISHIWLFALVALYWIMCPIAGGSGRVFYLTYNAGMLVYFAAILVVFLRGDLKFILNR